jgi:hypothetical protein
MPEVREQVELGIYTKRLKSLYAASHRSRAGNAIVFADYDISRRIQPCIFGVTGVPHDNDSGSGFDKIAESRRSVRADISYHTGSGRTTPHRIILRAHAKFIGMIENIIYSGRQVFHRPLRTSRHAVLNYESVVAHLTQFKSERETLVNRSHIRETSSGTKNCKRSTGLSGKEKQSGILPTEVIKQFISTAAPINHFIDIADSPLRIDIVMVRKQ